MQRVIIILVFLFTLSISGQEYQYHLYLKDSCTNNIMTPLAYHMEKDGKKFGPSDFDGLIKLPEKGQYLLTSIYLDEVFAIIIDKETNSDTINLPKVVEKIKWPPLSYSVTKRFWDSDSLRQVAEKRRKQENLPTFYICEEKCEGQIKDYYSNGSVKISGDFVNGLPVGELSKYYQNGQLKEISTYDKDGFLITRKLFSEKGDLLNSDN